jgi:hypothetical protein
MQVTWNAPADNGDAVSGYQLDVLRGSSLINSIPVAAGQTSQAVVVDTSTTDYTFRVRAQNKAGWGQFSATSAPQRAFTPPGAPTNVTAREGDRSLTVSYTPGASNGANAGELSYQASVNNGGWQALAGNGVIGGLTNGTSYTVRVRAVATVNGVSEPGAESAPSNAVVPYGPVRNPTVSATASGTSITFRWSPPTENGRAITAMQIRIDGGSWQDVALSNSRTNNYGYSERHTIEARAQDAAGQWSGIASDAATTVAAPQPKVWVTKGSSAQGQPNCSTSQCAYFLVHTENFPAGDYAVSCNATGPYGGTPFAGGSTRHLPANGTVQLGCYFGDDGEQVWVSIGGWGNSERRTWQ